MLNELTTEKHQSAHCYKTTLKTTYGLSDAWIKKLGEPDMVVPNPHYKKYNSYLYLRERVEAFIEENQDAWNKLQERRVKRSKISSEIAERKRQELLEWAENVKIKTASLPKSLGKLERLTQKNGSAFYDDFILSANAVVAYVRHNCTNYELLLDEQSGKIGTHFAYMIIRDRVNELIVFKLEQMYGDAWVNFAAEFFQ